MVDSAPRVRVFVDANVLWGGLTSDVLMSLAAERAIDIRWSEEVLDESDLDDVRRNAGPVRGTDAIERRLAVMKRAAPRALVTGFQHLSPAMPAHPGDRHVLAAAVHSRSQVLVTDNDKHFHPGEMFPELSVMRLDPFLRAMLRVDSDTVLRALSTMVHRHTRPPRTMGEFVDRAAELEEMRGFAIEVNRHLPRPERGQEAALTRPVAQLSPAAAEFVRRQRLGAGPGRRGRGGVER